MDISPIMKNEAASNRVESLKKNSPIIHTELAKIQQVTAIL